MGIQSFRSLKVWQRSMELVEQSYRLAAALPSHELYGLGSQIRRAAVSIPANLAEGNGREHVGDYRLQYFESDQINPMLELTAEVGRMLGGLRKGLKAKRDAGRR
jgi:hypothetical protein